MNSFIGYFKNHPDMLVAWLIIVAICVSVYQFTDKAPYDSDGNSGNGLKLDSVRAAKRISDSLQYVRENAEATKLQEEEDRRFYNTKAGRIHKKHPDWPRASCEKVADRLVWIGMQYDMLKYLRGLPNSANPSNYGNGTQWQWCWYDETPSCFYDNDNDGYIDAYN
jgi:hypothetical protein